MTLIMWQVCDKFVTIASVTGFFPHSLMCKDFAPLPWRIIWIDGLCCNQSNYNDTITSKRCRKISQIQHLDYFPVNVGKLYRSSYAEQDEDENVGLSWIRKNGCYYEFHDACVGVLSAPVSADNWYLPVILGSVLLDGNKVVCGVKGDVIISAGPEKGRHPIQFYREKN